MRRRLPSRLVAAAFFLGWALTAQAVASAEPIASRQIDKATQRRLGIVTVVPQSTTGSWLAARVVADLRRRWRAMADQAGVIEAPDKGFPRPGDAVVAGQVLAWLRPIMTDPERRDLQSQRRVVQRDFDLAQTQLKRFDIDAAQAIDVRLPTPSIQIVADYQGARERGAALDSALTDRIPIRVPVAGQLLEQRAQSRQVVGAGDPLFEGSGDAALSVELISDRNLLADTAMLAGAHAGDEVPVHRVSGAYDAGLRAWRLQYAIDPLPGTTTLLPGTPVRLRLASAPAPLRLPRSSVFRVQGDARVWVHESAERFVARPVILGPSEGPLLSVQSGLSQTDRVVVDASALLRPGALR